MNGLNFNVRDDHTTTKEMTEKNKELSRLLREQQMFLMEGNDYMVEKLGRIIEKLTLNMIKIPTKGHEDKDS
jgi:hypothetical protein